jgi:hypothetical protein
MIGSQELRIATRSGSEDSWKVSELCLISLEPLMARVTQDKKMEYTEQNDQASIYQSNFRAEDGVPTGRSNALYEGVVVPLASLFAVVAFVVGAMVISH